MVFATVRIFSIFYFNQVLNKQDTRNTFALVDILCICCLNYSTVSTEAFILTILCLLHATQVIPTSPFTIFFKLLHKENGYIGTNCGKPLTFILPCIERSYIRHQYWKIRRISTKVTLNDKLTRKLIYIIYSNVI